MGNEESGREVAGLASRPDLVLAAWQRLWKETAAPIRAALPPLHYSSTIWHLSFSPALDIAKKKTAVDRRWRHCWHCIRR